MPILLKSDISHTNLTDIMKIIGFHCNPVDFNKICKISIKSYGFYANPTHNMKITMVKWKIIDSMTIMLFPCDASRFHEHLAISKKITLILLKSYGFHADLADSMKIILITKT